MTRWILRGICFVHNHAVNDIEYIGKIVSCPDLSDYLANSIKQATPTGCTTAAEDRLVIFSNELIQPRHVSGSVLVNNTLQSIPAKHN